MFKKKNVDTLSNHQPYDYMIDLEECLQLEFKPIYNLSQDKFMAFQKYINKNLKKGSFNIPNFQLEPQSCLSRKRWTLCKCVLIIYCGLN
jgi:hypothetical protein